MPAASARDRMADVSAWIPCGEGDSATAVGPVTDPPAATTWARADAYDSPVRAMRARTRDLRCFWFVIVTSLPTQAAAEPTLRGRSPDELSGRTVDPGTSIPFPSASPVA